MLAESHIGLFLQRHQMYVGVRNFHPEHSHAHPLAGHGILQGHSHFLREGPESCVAVVVQIENVVVFNILGDDESVSLYHRVDVEEGIVVFAFGTLVRRDFSLGDTGENCCHIV